MSDTPWQTRAWAEVDLAALAHNLGVVRARVGSARKIIAAVKADAYGHGAVEASHTLLAAGADMLAVACVDEGAELRAAGIDAPVVVLGATRPEEAEALLAHDLQPVVCSDAVAQALDAAAEASGKAVKVHVKIDTGMGRIGVPVEQALEFVLHIAERKHLALEGMCTHFPIADQADKTFTLQQVQRFAQIVEELETRGVSVPLRHAANSPAIIDVPASYFNAVRPGLMLYGAYGSPSLSREAGLRQVLALKARVTFVKDVPAGIPLCYGHTFTTSRQSRIATVALGYGDGFDRRGSNTAMVLVRGRRVPVVGRICMDQCLIDVTDAPGVEVGDEVVAYGRQGGEFISLDEAAERLGTIPHVLMCAVSRRASRVYV